MGVLIMNSIRRLLGTENTSLPNPVTTVDGAAQDVPTISPVASAGALAASDEEMIPLDHRTEQTPEMPSVATLDQQVDRQHFADVSKTGEVLESQICTFADQAPPLAEGAVRREATLITRNEIAIQGSQPLIVWHVHAGTLPSRQHATTRFQAFIWDGTVMHRQEVRLLRKGSNAKGKPLYQSNIPRNKQGTMTDDPRAYKTLQGVQKAIEVALAAGRIRPGIDCTYQ